MQTKQVRPPVRVKLSLNAVSALIPGAQSLTRVTTFLLPFSAAHSPITHVRGKISLRVSGSLNFLCMSAAQHLSFVREVGKASPQEAPWPGPSVAAAACRAMVDGSMLRGYAKRGASRAISTVVEAGQRGVRKGDLARSMHERDGFRMRLGCRSGVIRPVRSV